MANSFLITFLSIHQVITFYEAKSKREMVAQEQLYLSSKQFNASASSLQLTAHATDEQRNNIWKSAYGQSLATQVEWKRIWSTFVVVEATCA